LLLIASGIFTQRSGSFVPKDIFGRACLLAGYFLEKGSGVPEFVAFGFTEGNTETNAEGFSSHPNSIILCDPKFSMIVVGLFELDKQLL
jgi:hypothetical protein